MTKLTIALLSASLLFSTAASAKMQFKGDASRAIHPTAIKAHKAPLKGKKQIRKVGEEIPEIITEAPAGEVKNYMKSAYMLFIDEQYFDITAETNYGMWQQVVYCEDGSVYMRNPVAAQRSEVYIKGTKDGNKLTFEFPQTLLMEHFVEGEEEWDETMTINLLELTYTEEDAFYYPVEDMPNQVTYTIADDGTISMDNEFLQIEEEGTKYKVPRYIVGVTFEDGEWSGYGDGSSELTPYDKTPLAMPSTLKAEKWAMRYNTAGHLVNVAIDGNDMYISGISQLCPDACVKGTIAGDKVTFESGQLLGVENEWFDFYVFLNSMTYEGEYYVMDDAIVMNYDAAKHILSMGEEQSLIVSGGEDMNYIIEEYGSPEIGIQPADISLYPASPVIEMMADYDPYIGAAGAIVRLSTMNADGYVLDTANIQYKMVVNGKDYTFDSKIYDGLDAPTLWLPYSFESYDVEVMEDVRIMYFYEENIESLQVVERYVDGDKTYEAQSPVYTKVAVEEIEAATDGKAAYYDFTGRRLTSAPEKGLYIRVSNGKAAKMVK